MKLTLKFINKIIDEIEKGKGLSPVQAIKQSKIKTKVGEIIVFAKDEYNYTYNYKTGAFIPEGFTGEAITFGYKAKEKKCQPLSINDCELAYIDTVSI